jgi:hypothetical protein
LLAAIGDIHRVHSAKALRQWAGVMPRSHQSSHTQRLGLGMTKAGPARVKRAPYQAAHYARIWDPGLGAIYYRQMVDLGKTHKQAMGVVMSHLLSRVYTVLKEERPYQLRDLEGNPVTMTEAPIIGTGAILSAGRGAPATPSSEPAQEEREPPTGGPLPFLGVGWEDHGMRGSHCSSTRPSCLHPKRAYQAISSGAMKSFYPLTYFRISS